MANLLDRFNKQVIGSDVIIYDYLAKIIASGDFKRIRDIDVILVRYYRCKRNYPRSIKIAI